MPIASPGDGSKGSIGSQLLSDIRTLCSGFWRRGQHLHASQLREIRVSFPKRVMSKLRSRAKKELVRQGVDRRKLLRQGLSMLIVLKGKVSTAWKAIEHD